MTKITLTKAEAFDIIRNNFGVGSGIEIDIADDPVSKDVDGWIDVPIDWDKESPPDAALMFNTVEVQHRNGDISISDPKSFRLWWKQDDHYWDIIRYRGY